VWCGLDMMTEIPASGSSRIPAVQPITFKTLYWLYELLTLMSEYQKLYISIISSVPDGSNSGIAIGKSDVESFVTLYGVSSFVFRISVWRR
jgi:hypothetical protein